MKALIIWNGNLIDYEGYHPEFKEVFIVEDNFDLKKSQEEYLEFWKKVSKIHYKKWKY